MKLKRTQLEQPKAWVVEQVKPVDLETQAIVAYNHLMEKQKIEEQEMWKSTN